MKRVEAPKISLEGERGGVLDRVWSTSTMPNAGHSSLIALVARVPAARPTARIVSTNPRRHDSAFGHQLAQAIAAGRRGSGHDVRERTASKRDSNLLPATDRPQRLTQRLLQLADTNLTHVDTSASRRALRGGKQDAEAAAVGTLSARG